MSSPGPSLWSTRVARLEPWAASGLVLAATVGLAFHCRYLAVPIVDDAAISLAYGQTLFSGHGFRITPFSQVVEGFSNPLWTLLLGLSKPLRQDPATYSHVLGIVFGVLALPLFSLWGPAAKGRRPRLEDALGPLVAALNPTYAYWISSGMETGLQSFLLSLSGFFVLKELRTGRSSHAGWALGLLCLTRPEGVLFAGASAVLWAASRGLERQGPGRQEWRIGAWLVALVGGWLVVRWSVFADLLPNTYYAKSVMDFQVEQYLETFARTYEPLCLLAAVCAVLGLLGGRDEVRRTALTCLFVGCGVFFVLRAKGDWMREWRFLAPLVPLLGVAVATGVSGLREWSARMGDRGAVWPARALRFLTVVLVLVPGYRVARESLQRSPQVKAAPELPYTFIAGLAEQVLATTRQLGQLRPLVAYPDLGGLAMVMRNAEIIDLAGLADSAVARHRLRLGATEDYLLSEGPPILMDLHGPSGYFVNLPKLMAQFHPIGGPIFMLNGLSATEDPRCPEGKAGTLALGAEALVQRFEQEIREDQAPQALKRWRCVTAYKPRKELPDAATRKRLAELANARGDTLLRAGQREPALRQYSLATLLDDGNAHRRHKTETLRAQLFPADPP